jgi:hypothetical protein
VSGITINNKNLNLAVTTERRDVVDKRRILGHVVSCSGSKVQIASVIPKDDIEFSKNWSVGRLVSIAVGENRVVALVSSMRMPEGNWNVDGSNTLNVEA